MRYVGSRNNWHYFAEDGHHYGLVERPLRDGSTWYGAYVGFERITNNVFGNGSTDVYQSGWRSLPRNGPKYRRLVGWFEVLKRTNRLKVAA